MTESRDPQPEEPVPEMPGLELQGDNAALHALASRPRLWKAYQEIANALRDEGPPENWWLDFGVGGSMMSLIQSAGQITYTYDDATAHETESTEGRRLNGVLAVLDVDDER